MHYAVQGSCQVPSAAAKQCALGDMLLANVALAMSPALLIAKWQPLLVSFLCRSISLNCDCRLLEGILASLHIAV